MWVIVLVALVLLITWGLERNRRRQPYPRPPLAGSTDVQDRDAERARSDVRAAADRADWRG